MSGQSCDRRHDGRVNLRSDRLLLRMWDPTDDDDVAAAFDIYRRDEVSRWLGANPAPWESLEQTRERLDQWLGVSFESPGFGLWAITLGRNQPPIGTILLDHLPDAQGEDTEDVEVGWHLHPDAWGNGYATEAAQKILEHAWEIDVTEVNALAYPGNDRSVAVMERLGMERQGTTSKWYGVELEWWLVGAPLPSAA